MRTLERVRFSALLPIRRLVCLRRRAVEQVADLRKRVVVIPVSIGSRIALLRVRTRHQGRDGRVVVVMRRESICLHLRGNRRESAR